MGVVKFYHLTGSPMEEVAQMLLSRATGLGWRVMLRGQDAARLDWLDGWLWTHPPEGFLPHGRQGGRHDALQPVLLGTGPLPEGARGLMAVDGAGVTPEEAEAVERVWILFDGLEETALERARAQWRDLTGAGVAAEYWSEASGRWEQKR
ncbi:MAG: DNA polymerase III subunit chi [Pseudorhodobacter sp.]